MRGTNGIIFVFLLFAFALPANAQAETNAVHISNNISSDLVFSAPFEIGSVAYKDLGTDGVKEIVVGSFSAPTTVAILRQDGSLISSFVPYDKATVSGVNVSAGNVSGDSQNEVITAPSFGGAPEVRIFDSRGKFQSSFFAFEKTFTGGVSLAVADINGDKQNEIVAAAGITGGPHIRIFRANGELVQQFFAFDSSDRAGLTVAPLDVNNDGISELLVSRFGASIPEARLVSFTNGIANLHTTFPLYDVSYRYGVTLSTLSPHEVIVTPNGHGGPHVKIFSFDIDGNPTLKSQFYIFNESNENRVLSAGNHNDSFYFESPPVLQKRLGKHIVVDLKSQRLTAYEHGIQQNSFLISSGLWDSTPHGEFSVQRKLPWHNYVRFYGEGDKRNYNLPNVEFNLQFKRGFYIHYAYWHNNFGKPMSHGCVNAPYDGMKWLYAWTSVDTSVIIK